MQCYLIDIVVATTEVHTYSECNPRGASHAAFAPISTAGALVKFKTKISIASIIKVPLLNAVFSFSLVKKDCRNMNGTALDSEGKDKPLTENLGTI